MIDFYGLIDTFEKVLARWEIPSDLDQLSFVVKVGDKILMRRVIMPIRVMVEVIPKNRVWLLYTSDAGDE